LERLTKRRDDRAVELELHHARRVVADARHHVLGEVGEPEPTVVPARSFTDADVAQEHREPRHGGEPTALESGACALLF
jgi:hypothetical protein